MPTLIFKREESGLRPVPLHSRCISFIHSPSGAPLRASCPLTSPPAPPCPTPSFHHLSPGRHPVAPPRPRPYVGPIKYRARLLANFIENVRAS
jgi:hypothetical protein